MSTSFQTPRPPTDPTNIPAGNRRPVPVSFAPAAASLTTSNGVVWTLRARNAQGLALYAPATVRDCPRLVLATVAELAAHGIVSASDAAPEPADPAADVRAPIIARTRIRRDDLDRVRARAAADREAYRAEMDERLAAEHRAHGAPVPASVQARIDARRAADGHREQIAQLAERRGGEPRG